MKILHNITKKIIFESEHKTIKETLVYAVKEKANLQGADLQGADLRRADLQGADLRRADLRRADLRGADLCDCNLHEAKISYRDKTIKILFEEVKE